MCKLNIAEDIFLMHIYPVEDSYDNPLSIKVSLKLKQKQGCLC